MTTRHEATHTPSERVQAFFVVVGLIVLALIARAPSPPARPPIPWQSHRGIPIMEHAPGAFARRKDRYP